MGYFNLVSLSLLSLKNSIYSSSDAAPFNLQQGSWGNKKTEIMDKTVLCLVFSDSCYFLYI